MSDEFAPSEGARLVHLGDGIFHGSENSQFQAPATATHWALKLGTIPSELNLSGYSSLRLTYAHRGLQASLCHDSVRFFQSDDSRSSVTSITTRDDTSNPSNPTLASTLAISGSVQAAIAPTVEDSPSDGSYGTQTLSFPIASIDRTKALWVELISGDCGPQSDAADDFEVVNVNAKLMPP